MDEQRRISSRLASSEVARANFASVRKGGLDPQEVHQYLESVAREMGALEGRLRDSQTQLAEALQRAAHPTVDEATLASALGTQSAAILRSAHEEAGRVTAEAQERSAQVFSESQQRAAQHLIEAQERAAQVITEAENTAHQIEHDARLAAERLVESAKLNGEALLEHAREQGRAILEQAQAARRSVLGDLAVKRKALTLQIEQLRAARDSLNAFTLSLREQVDTVLAGLANSDEAARVAAVEALRLRPPSPEPSEEELLAGTPLREVPAPAPVAPPAAAEETGAAEAPRRRAPASDRSAPAVARPVPAPASPAAPSEKAPARTPAPAPTSEESGVGAPEEGPSEEATDVVNEIFARLRKATLEERGASAPAPRRASAAPKHPSPDADLFARRDAALSEALALLTRKVKRALQDDQNATLERLRDVKGMITTEMEDEHDQRDRYASAALEALADAAAAGSRFAFDESGAHGAAPSRAALADCSADLAVTVVLALRRRILTEGAGDATERANAAYKEWRGARVERLCADVARRAFSIGVVAACDGRDVRFVPAPNDAPCDACALDAQSGTRRAGLAFPSGSAYPPLHAGCACAVVPA